MGRRLLKLLCGLALLPACVVLTQSLWHVIGQAHPAAEALPPGARALLGGFLLWIAIFFLLPRPFRTYVLAHELTHALWGLLMGARIARIRVAQNAGSVELSKTNFWIALAPYFFPFYTVLTVLAYTLADLVADPRPWRLWWLGAVGLTWGFHFTFTIVALTLKQSDIRAHGHLFSYTVIYAMNALGIGLWIVMVSEVTFAEAFARLQDDSLRLAARAVPLLRQLTERAATYVQ